MTNNIGAWLVGDEWARIQGEVQRFLDTWSFFIAESGLIYARPTMPALTPRHLCAFLRRLLVICDETFPGVILLDFCGVEIGGRHRSRLNKELDRFARGIEARHVHKSCRDATGDYSLIYRPRCLGWTIPGFCLPFGE